MISATDGSAFTGTVSVVVTKDGGTQSAGGGTVTHEGSGFHSYTPTQGETDAAHVAFTFTGTGAVPQTVQVYTRAATPDVNVTQFGGSAGTFASGRPEVNTSHVAGSAISQSGGLINANVTQISGDAVAADNLEAAADGTGYNLGAGQVVAASVTGAVGSVTGAVGSVAGNVGGNVAGSVGSVATGGITAASIAADAITSAKVADGCLTAAKFASGAFDAVWTVTTRTLTAISDSSGVTTLLSKLSGITSLAQWLGALAGKTADTTTRAEINATTSGASYNETTDSQEALRDRGDAAWITATGFSTLDAAGVRAAVGLTSANLDTQLDALPTAAENASQVRTELTTELGRIDAAVSTRLASASYTAPLDAAGTRTAVGLASPNLDTQLSTIDGVVDAILVDTAEIGAAGAGLTEAGGTGDHLTAVPYNAAWDAEIQSEVQDALDATLADSVPADGSRPSAAQALYAIYQFLTERSVSGTTLTVRKPDGSTALMTFTLNDSSAPTSITRAS